MPNDPYPLRKGHLTIIPEQLPVETLTFDTEILPGTLICLLGMLSDLLETLFCHTGKHGGLISAPPIPVGFRSFLWIPVEFRRNLPAKISLLPQNCVIPVFTLEWSPEPSHQNGPRSLVTGMAPESSDWN